MSISGFSDWLVESESLFVGGGGAVPEFTKGCQIQVYNMQISKYKYQGNTFLSY